MIVVHKIALRSAVTLVAVNTEINKIVAIKIIAHKIVAVKIRKIVVKTLIRKIIAAAIAVKFAVIQCIIVIVNFE